VGRDDGRIGGLILAAGRSRRLGRPKQSLPFGNGTLLEHAIAQVEAVSELDPIVVVLPSEGLSPSPRVTRATLTRVEAEGACSSSLHAGLRALPDGLNAVMVLPADQPALDSELIGLAARSWTHSRPPALTLAYRGEPGHPLVFSAPLFDELRTLHGEKAMWRLLESQGVRVERVPVNRPIPHDIDTEDDYRRVIASP
jgi:molybdenum cofactor cytidylyltransferase